MFDRYELQIKIYNFGSFFHRYVKRTLSKSIGFIHFLTFLNTTLATVERKRTPH